MKTWRGLLGVTVFAVGVGAAYAQTPVLGSIEAPYAALQSPVKIANTQWGPGAVAYGPANTPLVLHGLDLGGSGTVQFVAYKNGAVDTNVNPVQATVTMWSPTMLFLTVPAGAMSGLVTVTSEGKTSNGLPFLVTPGIYSGRCPAGPTTTQLQITTASLPDGTVSQAYSVTLLASGGTTAYSWSITSGSLPSGLSLNASTGTISGTPTAASGPVDVTFQVTDSSSPSQHDRAVLSLTIEPPITALSPATVYQFKAPASGTSGSGYDGVGNLTSYTDTVMGTWNMTAPGGGSGYDTLNRLMAANVTWPDGTQQIACWSYDAFGNRTMESLSSVACNANPTPTTWAQYNGTVNGTNNNQMSQTYQNTNQGNGYDPAGNVTFDGVNTYTYDAEGRICAVKSEPMPGMTAMTGYLYDADGVRVAKGTITTMSCDPTTNGFQFTENYVLGPGGEELTMIDGNNNWQRTNVYAGGKLLATYDTLGLHFHLEDPLGTRRMQLAGNLPGSAYGCPIGQPETDIQSLPFGDQLNSYPDQYACSTADDSTPLHFTGKERDYESGNDYFGARYYASSMGRFMSPDWAAQEEPVPYAKPDDPQSLNLYAYVENNPLLRVDADGHFPDWGDVAAFVGGAVNAWTSDNLLGAGRQEQGSAAGQIGAMVGDAVAVYTASQEMATGGGMALAGAGETLLTAPAAASGAGALIPAAGAAVATAGVVMGVHGATVAGTAAMNLSKAGGNFSSKTKQDAKAAAGGKCQNCGTETTPGQKSQKGVTPPGTEGQTDHIVPKSKGGTNEPSNAQHLCRDCNLKKSDKLPGQQ
jgi:RHS repeat-associated protein